jgi:hypothetical protein
LAFGPVTVVPPGADLAEPVVTPVPVFAPDPDELAVPALLVPGGGGVASLDELPAPLGSLPELFSPPEFAGPDGTPLTPDVPAPADLAPPPLPPPLPPPPLCAWAIMGRAKIAIAVIAAVTDVLVIGHLGLPFNHRARCWFPERFPHPAI